jgi:hypothetical protein
VSGIPLDIFVKPVKARFITVYNRPSIKMETYLVCKRRAKRPGHGCGADRVRRVQVVACVDFATVVLFIVGDKAVNTAFSGRQARMIFRASSDEEVK